MGLFSSIHYIVGIPDKSSDDKTLFQGFTEEALYAVEPLLAIARLPSNIFEVFIPREKWTSPRVGGATNFSVHIAHESILPTSVKPSVSAPWWVVILPQEQLDVFKKAFGGGDIPPLTTSVTYSAKHPFPQLSSTTKEIKSWARKVLSLCMQRGSLDARTVSNVLSVAKNKSLVGSRKISFPVRAHNVTIPNELAMLAVGYDFDGFSSFPAFSFNASEQPSTMHDQAVAALSSAIQNERNRLISSSPRHALPLE